MKKRKEIQKNSQFSVLNSQFSTVLIVVLAGIPFLMGRYFELSYPDPFDSAANVYSAQHILNGARIGIDERPSAALGTLLVNILGVWIFGFRELGPKLIQTIMQGGAFVVMYVAMKKLYGKLPAAIGVIVAIIYTSAPLLAKFGNVKEQFMIACMVTGISLFVLRQLGGGWWYSFLAGAVVAWAPLFKETGSSAIGAIGLFVLLQPVFGHRTWKQTGIDIFLLLAGAAAAMAPLYIWIIGWKVQMTLPYFFVWDAIAGLIPKAQSSPAQAAPTYISSIRETISFSDQWPKVLRYYLALCLPVSLAAGAIIARLSKLVFKFFKRSSTEPVKCGYDRFVPLFGVWWLLDMAFVWISPASYEQYYLPLTVSGAATGCYLIAVYRDKLSSYLISPKPGTAFKIICGIACIAGLLFIWIASRYIFGIKGNYVLYAFMLVWVISWLLFIFTCIQPRQVWLFVLLLMVVMSWHIFSGLPISPFSGMWYENPDRRNGYLQRWREVSYRVNEGRKGPWEMAGEYIREHTKPTDKIYVWGWVPAVYLSAQRFCPAPVAFESEMHTRPPEQLEQVIDELLASFRKEMPKYIVDTRKQHLPIDRLKFELWPIIGYSKQGQPQFLPKDPQIVAEFEKQWEQLTREKFGDDEARRFEIMGKFRKFVRDNYDIDKMFGDEVVFKLKPEAGKSHGSGT